MSNTKNKNVCIQRLMTQLDANLAGNVHGGTILSMIEEAGLICSTRYFNSDTESKGKKRSGLARVEHTSFNLPMFVGTLATLEACVTYVSAHSCEVRVDVFAEDLLSGRRANTNTATLWYVCVDGKDGTVAEAPSTLVLSEEQLAAGRQRYELQKQDRKERAEARVQAAKHRSVHDEQADSPRRPVSPASFSVGGMSVPTAEFIQQVTGEFCDQFGFMRGGALMKLMDSAAGVAAFKHCRTNIVTASLEAIDFRVPVKLGCIIRIIAIASFTSSRSMEIEVVVDAQDLRDNTRNYCTTTATFVFVSLDKNNKILPIKPLEPTTEEEIKRFEQGKLRYERRKSNRSVPTDTKTAAKPTK